MSITETEWKALLADRQAAAAGDLAAWESLFARLWGETVVIAGSEDSAMAGWTKIVKDPRLWLKELPFFKTIFKNAGRDEDRGERRHQRRIAALFASIRPFGFPDTRIEEIDVKWAVSKLTASQQAVMQLYLKDQSLGEIAAQRGISHSTARRILNSALAELQKWLGGQSGNGTPAA